MCHLRSSLNSETIQAIGSTLTIIEDDCTNLAITIYNNLTEK
jgi:hypothetical protein